MCYHRGMLTVVIPTFNELKTNLLPEILEGLLAHEAVEIIVVDSNSSDGTKELVGSFEGVKFLSCSGHTRAHRLNQGIKNASHEMVLLHHPRSIITPQGIEFLKKNVSNLTWGAFTHKFDHVSPLLNFKSWYSNHIRGDIRSIYYLDHCIFAKKSLLNQVGLLPEIPIFEDTEICLKLASVEKGRRIGFDAITSAIRFRTNGILKQSLLNQILKWKFYFKSDLETMNEKYEENLDLNNTYKKK